MVKYIVKHYWDKTTKSATIEPRWLTSGDTNLTEEQQKVKKIYKKTLGDANYYNSLIVSKKSSETIDGCKIEYIYEDNIDPLNTNNRKAVDITMQIYIPKKSKFDLKKNIFIIFFILIFGIVIYLLFLKQEQSDIVSKKSELVSKAKNTIKQQLKKEEKKKVEQKKEIDICKIKIKIKKDDELNDCLQSYIKDYCAKKTTKKMLDYFRSSPECFIIKSLKISDISFLNLHNQKEKAEAKKIIKNLIGDNNGK